ncbi:cell division protein SepF [Corynebacterium heidelbergense]|uniref:Cell division protein SepF n=1 Tax=Corynebacterium heidelbergense TaxID=2055947 RepID=A0A364V6I4_9CORY|nr:cell division protein SepF [Corynebacterium heidelbergense]RAV32270.1 cell division protein SepF [Corynebacterium heidelbergense]
MAEGFGGKIKDFFGLSDVDSYEEAYDRERFAEERDPRDARDGAARRDHRGYSDYRAEHEDHGLGRGGRESRDEHVAEDRYARRGEYREYGDAGSRRSSYEAPAPHAESRAVPHTPQVVRLVLSSYRQAGEIAEAIRGGDVVVFSLSGMEKAEASRVLDFSAGLARGVDADLKKLRGVRNFVLIPAGLTLEQSQLDQLVEDN